ncbi:MAG: hypothetical protein QOH26_1414 [Actinomycetota bacterium]|nr:hypothetical protein [Actinomycetota bacterium]
MGFMDKVKAAAQDAAAQAKTATGQAQSKLEQVQLKKKLDDAAEKLGHLIYAERTKGTPAGAEADRLVEEMKEIEGKMAAEAAETSAGAASPPSDAPSQVSTSSAEPTSGDFKL